MEPLTDAEIAKRFGSMGGKARSRNLTPQQKRDSARKAAILRWYPTEELFLQAMSDPKFKRAYLAEMKKLRAKNKPQ